MNGWVQPRKENLTGRLASREDPGDAANELYWSIFARAPTPNERNLVAEYWSSDAVERKTAAIDLAWALLASAEFRFNH